MKLTGKAAAGFIAYHYVKDAETLGEAMRNISPGSPMGFAVKRAWELKQQDEA